MKLKHYIQGDKRGKEANRLERQAMSDPFLHDALEGLDSIPGHHANALERLEKKIALRSAAGKRKQQITWWAVAATILLMIGMAGYFFMQNENDKAPVIATTLDTSPKTEASKDNVTEIAKQAEEQKQEKTVQKFTPPVTKADEELSEEQEITTQQEVMSNTAAVGAVNFDKGTDDVVVEPPVAIQADESADTGAIIALEPNNKTLNEVPTVLYGARKSAQPKATSVNESQKNQLFFGRKEFQEYVKKNARKNICGEKPAYVKVEFSIGLKGTPYRFNFKEFSCEEAKLEMERLLIHSPAWTKTNIKVSLQMELQ